MDQLGMHAASRHIGCRRALIAAAELAVAGITDRDPSIRQASASALGCLGTQAGSQVGALNALAVAASNAREVLEVRCAAAKAIGTLAEAASPTARDARDPISMGLRSADSKERLMATEALVKFLQYHKEPGDDAAAYGACRTALVDLTDPCRSIRIAACRAVAACGNRVPVVADSLMALLDDDDVYVQCAAAEALGTCRPVLSSQCLRAAVEVAQALLCNPYVWIRLAAASAIGSLRDTCREELTTDAIRVTVQAFIDESCAVRVAAIRTLASLGPLATPHVWSASEIAEALLQHEQLEVCIEAAAALGMLQSLSAPLEREECSSAAAGLLCDDAKQRASAAIELSSYGLSAKQHAEDIAAALHDPSAEVRDAAGTALGAMGDEGIGHLAVALRSRDWRARVAASRALRGLGYEVDVGVSASITAMRDA
eukprot:TRINITY_DN22747_c0_g1_i1.p1 TRINITY_DN22747_c0_g1~~TRINITY_DN22747_c0_g1_i1.p1  ORF type:complete len:430 (+),score=81.20 TRINITY_DN22747_c0_g1_i1:154-1443(+)